MYQLELYSCHYIATNNEEKGFIIGLRLHAPEEAI